jgi:hypothetical protein
MMMKNTIGLLTTGMALTALLVAPSGAAGQQATEGDAFEEVTAPANKPVRLYVQNNNWLDVNVYAVRGGTRFRLGVVRSAAGRFFELPDHLTSNGLNVQLQASPIGQRGSVTEAVPISPGDIVEWRIQNNLNLSSLSVWST